MDIDLQKRLQTLNQVILDCVNLSTEKEIVKRFADAAVKALKADYGFSFWMDPKKRWFSLLYKSPNTPYNPEIPRRRGTTQKTFDSKKPLYIKSLPKVQWGRDDAKPFMKGVVVIPITYKEQNYGTIDICYFNEHKFSKAERTLCEYLGHGAAQAITINRLKANLLQTNKTLEGSVRRRTRELEKSRDFLRAERAKDEAILSSIGEGILAVDIQGRIILVNPQAENILGEKKSGLLGKILSENHGLFDDQGRPIEPARRPNYLALTQGKKIRSKPGEIYLRRKGKLLPISLTANPIRLKDEIVGAIQVFRDVTKEKEIDQVKSELISLASHQLRTPLSAINWYSEALLSGDLGRLPSGQRQYLQEIFRANQKMVELVYDFLNVSRMELGTFSIRLSTIDVAELSRGVLRESAPLIAQKKLRLSEHYGPGLGGIQADRKILRIVLQNLITNAVKYSRPRGKIAIKLDVKKKAGKNLLLMTVKDNGIGIPKPQQAKVFSKLFRADNVSQLDTEGTGLGLYIAKSFLQYCKGKIWFTSKEGQGSVFFAKIPVIQLRKAPRQKQSVAT